MSEHTPEAMAFMSANFPMFVKWLQMPQTLDGFANQGKKVNWDWVNDVERTCGLPMTSCPDHIAAGHFGGPS